MLTERGSARDAGRWLCIGARRARDVTDTAMVLLLGRRRKVLEVDHERGIAVAADLDEHTHTVMSAHAFAVAGAANYLRAQSGGLAGSRAARLVAGGEPVLD